MHIVKKKLQRTKTKKYRNIRLNFDREKTVNMYEETFYLQRIKKAFERKKIKN